MSIGNKFGWMTVLCAVTVLMNAKASGAEKVPPEIVTDGIFGEALDACLGAVQTGKPLPLDKAVPFTVELWAKINQGGGVNVLIANEPEESATHWKLYTDQDGILTAHFPGMEPSVIKSPRNKKSIIVKRWRYIAMTWDGDSVALFVEGDELVRRKLSPGKEAGDVIEGPLTIGQAASLSSGQARTATNTVDCNGSIDEVRISSGVRKIVKKGVLQPFAQRFESLSEENKRALRMAYQSFTVDENTIGLWRFDRGGQSEDFLIDESKNANHLVLSPTVGPGKSELDKASYNAGPSPLDSNAETVSLKPGAVDVPAVPPVVSLDGEWQMVQATGLEDNLSGKWEGAMPAPVPGSVHTALFKNGVIPDPYFGRNQELTAPWSDKTYFFRKEFRRPPEGQDETLVFEGICNRSTIWLNGEKLGDHEGMFIPVAYRVKDRLKDHNTLVVKLDPAIQWGFTVVFNNSYGWHYAKFPPLGIWQPVYVQGEPAVKMHSPFIATRDISKGTMDLVTDISGPAKGWSGKMTGVIEPENFKGKSFHFEQKISATTGETNVHVRFDMPDPKLWWPVDMGEPNLYRLKLAFVPDGKGRADACEIVFGIRTIEKKPVAGFKHSNVFDWTFVVNGRPMFVKGTGWCTADAMMDFSRERYERFISLAKDQHIQMLRAWGSGMVETDDFYDLCNRYGVMVLQEWPTAWDSHRDEGAQPYDLLERTVHEGIIRLRNHPSLVLYGGGNESGNPYGKAIDMMGRLAIELDGTREFHRSEGGGGSSHDYAVFHGRQHFDNMFQMKALFWGEYGIASYPDYESVMRFLPDDEKNLWPVTREMENSFTYHTPTFNNKKGHIGGDWDKFAHVAGYYTEGKTMGDFIRGTQVAQAAGNRAALERARTRWPFCTGALYYKMNDNCPAASWATVDWYGAPKIGHYLTKHSFAPLVGVVLFEHETTFGLPLTVPVFLLDDADALKDKSWEVQVRAYDSDLKQIKELKFKGANSIGKVKRLGEFSLDAKQTKTNPLFMVIDVLVDGKLSQRNYNFTNCEKVKDSLFNLPKSRVVMSVKDGEVLLKNTGNLPAFGVEIRRPGHQDTFTADDNYIWLNPGETKTIKVNTTEGLKLEGWNL